MTCLCAATACGGEAGEKKKAAVGREAQEAVGDL